MADYTQYPQGGGLSSGLGAPAKQTAVSSQGGGLASGLGPAPVGFSPTPFGGGLATATAPGPVGFSPLSQGGGLGGGRGMLGAGVFVVTPFGGGLGGGGGTAAITFAVAPLGGGLAGGRGTASGDISTGLWYNVYGNTGAGDPINYGTKLAVLDVLTWTSSVLAFPGVWKFGVRAQDSGGEEHNIDAVVTIRLDGAGVDITAIPAAPTALTGHAAKAGAIVIDWHYRLIDPAKKPTAFHVYQGTGGSPSYASPVATVTYSSGIQFFTTRIAGLADGTPYTFAVRAFNATGEEANTTTVTITADATGPPPVYSLVGGSLA